MKRYLSYFLLAIVLTVTLIGASACTPAELQALQGTLKNVDSASGTVTVTMKDGTTKTFNFDNVTVSTLKQALGGASLEIGDQVSIKTNKHGDVEELEAKNAEVQGIIKSLGADNVTITTAKKGDFTLNVTTKTVIKFEDNLTAAYSDLKVNQKVEVKYDISTKNALRINVDRQLPEGNLQGTITAIDNATATIKIATLKQGDITLKVTATTVIRMEEKGTIVFKNLKVGQNVEVKYQVGSLTALKIKVDENDNQSNGNNNDKQRDNKDENNQNKNNQGHNGD
jgi:hypothetical protein